MKQIHIASTVILNPNNELLLVRKKGSDYFQLVGGKIQKDENEIDTVIRETFEEIGLQLAVSDLTYLGEHQTQAVNEKDTLVYGSIFIVQLSTAFTPSIANEIEAYTWMNLVNYQQYQWAHLAKEFVQPWWLKLNS
ncbi:MAG TPA: NUDIX domain-containing protein [Flavobacterium sp.]|nr:NUDIX domain-containing protein [Flavobacterium sp.]